MLYQRKTFTCPTANPKQSELRWDLAMLSDQEFEEKYHDLKANVIDDFTHTFLLDNVLG